MVQDKGLRLPEGKYIALQQLMSQFFKIRYRTGKEAACGINEVAKNVWEEPVIIN